MLQDIFPAQLKIEYENLPPQDECPLIVFVGECALVSFKNGEFFFPSVGDFSAYKSSMRYLFRLNDESFFLLNLDSLNAPDGYSLENMQSFRTAQPQYKAFAVVTAKHISSFLSLQHLLRLLRCAAEAQRLRACDDLRHLRQDILSADCSECYCGAD